MEYPSREEDELPQSHRATETERKRDGEYGEKKRRSSLHLCVSVA
jgi:hypothetical protein